MSERNEDAADHTETHSGPTSATGMRLHPRTLKVEEWKAEVKIQFRYAIARTELTEIEIIQCVGELLQDAVRDALRIERHGTRDRKADER